MKLIVDTILNDELKDYLLSQDGITEVNISNNNTELDIKYNSPMTPKILRGYIELFDDYKLIEFDKEIEGSFKTLKYVVNDLCCDFCYLNFINDMYENDNIKSVRSTFDYSNLSHNIEVIIEYKEYDESELIEYINEKLR